MSQFRIKTQAPDGSEPVLLYDNQTSSLTWEDGRPVAPVQPRQYGDATVVSVDQPGLKGVIKTLKVSLGLSCNYECNYCSQRFVPHAESSNPDDIEPFVAQLTGALTQAPQRIEFWGGEPFVYWKTLKPLAERLRVLYPDADFNIITNGSLLDEEKTNGLMIWASVLASVTMARAITRAALTRWMTQTSARPSWTCTPAFNRKGASALTP